MYALKKKILTGLGSSYKIFAKHFVIFTKLFAHCNI